MMSRYSGSSPIGHHRMYQGLYRLIRIGKARSVAIGAMRHTPEVTLYALAGPNHPPGGYLGRALIRLVKHPCAHFQDTSLWLPEVLEKKSGIRSRHSWDARISH